MCPQFTKETDKLTPNPRIYEHFSKWYMVYMVYLRFKNSPVATQRAVKLCVGVEQYMDWIEQGLTSHSTF